MAVITGRLQNKVLHIEFRDQATRNSFSLQAAEELSSLLDQNLGSAQSILFSSPHARIFCSGGNLKDYAALPTAEAGHEINRRIAGVLDRISQLAIPTVCLVHGDCFGGGLELMSSFDIVLASPYSLFGFWQRKAGLSFGWGGGARLEKRLGEHRLRQMALSAATFGAIEAQRSGVIDGICLEALMHEQALARIRERAELPVQPASAIKALTRQNERETFENLWWGVEHRTLLAQRRSSR